MFFTWQKFVYKILFMKLTDLPNWSKLTKEEKEKLKSVLYIENYDNLDGSKSISEEELDKGLEIAAKIKKITKEEGEAPLGVNTPLTIPDAKFMDYRDKIWGDSYNWSWNRPLSQVQYLVIHHTVTSHDATPDDIALLHKARGWCFPLTTEVLTNNGWKKYEQFNVYQDMVAVYEEGGITFKKAGKIIFNEWQETAKAKTLNADFEFSLNHKIYSSSGLPTSYAYRLWSEEVESRRGNVVCKVAGHYSGENQSPQYESEIYTIAAITAADGWYYRKEGVINGIGFDFVKERKVKYLQALLDKTKVKHTRPKMKAGKYHRFRINKESVSPFVQILGENKTLPFNLLHLPIRYREAILNAYIETDGWNSKHTPQGRDKDKYQVIFSTNKQNIDVLQAIIISLGMRATLKVIKRQKPRKTIYRLSIVQKDEVVVDLRQRTVHYNLQPTWSVDMQGKLIFVRHNGKVVVTHNSGIRYPSFPKQLSFAVAA